MTILTALILIYLAALLWFGIRGNTHDHTIRSLLTAGGATGAVLCALSLVSTIIGGSATLGIGSLAQKTGAGAFWWLGVGTAGLFLHGLFVAPAIRASGAITLPDVIRKLVGPLAEKWAALIIAVSWVAVTAAQFAALLALLRAVSGGALAEWLYAALAGAIVLHTALGGQRGVIRTDAIQAVLLLGGFAAAAVWCVVNRPDEVAALPRIPFSDTFGAVDLVKMLLLVGITYVIGPDMFSRTFAAKDGATARIAACTAAPLLSVFGVFVTMLALLNIEAAQPVADWLSAASPLPEVIAAFLALGLVSALSGSADTVLLSAAGIVEKDLIGGERVRAVRLWTAALGGLAALSAWFSGDIIGYLLMAYSFFVPGVAVPLLFLVFGRTRRAHPALWLTGAVLGGLGGLAGNLTGESLWTYAGMAVASVMTLAAIAAARSGSAVRGVSQDVA
ncbi:hypothetical protein [Sutterella sp.]|uniref:sodium:solute symporter family transporter n=1 Tax=Sutterella sp. TaxID=1981025 RepID=UPI0026DFDB40|nr:hypothetical protein [Sutterella sp.]MDO5532426.1 hypothetical protein [Sutterella sp.]